MFPALFVANYIIEYASSIKKPVNNLKLQKLLYFLYARFLLENNQPLFEEKFQKWKFGPVLPDVYHIYKQFGAFEILPEDMLVSFIRIKDLVNLSDTISFEVVEYERSKISDLIPIIQNTVDSLINYGPFELVDKTHEQEIWKKDEHRILDGVQGIVYEVGELKEYFENNPEAQLWQNVN